ncbi:7658_t:CDS:2, partial [Dentiscutata erythropus]
PFQLNKKATNFQLCVQDYFDPFVLFTVAMQPDPLVSDESAQFNVSGTLTKKNITAGQTILEIVFAPYIQIFDKSYDAGIPFAIFALNVSVPTLPDSYYNLVFVGDPTSDPKYPLDIYGCARAAMIGSFCVILLLLSVRDSWRYYI